MKKANVHYPLGFRAWGMAAGIKERGRPDLAILVSEPPAAAFGAFTTNAFPAAPVLFDRRVLDQRGAVSHVLVNSGNANACTGAEGDGNAAECAELAARAFGAMGGVLVSSTGIIGRQLPMDKLRAGIAALPAAEAGGDENSFASAIMTTDTVRKTEEISLVCGGREVRIGGCTKGAGMICPGMATMLCYVTTDIGLPASFREIFLGLVDRSFNSISVDGDMSTNDTVLLLANGASGVSYEALPAAERRHFDEALGQALRSLARQIVRDGEGATKLVQLRVAGASSDADARKAAFTVANSMLVKTALFGGDPNWGRVVAALGRSGATVDPAKVDVRFGGTAVFLAGAPVAGAEEELRSHLQGKDVDLQIDLHLDSGEWTVWTCDLSYEYVKINADYHT